MWLKYYKEVNFVKLLGAISESTSLKSRSITKQFLRKSSQDSSKYIKEIGKHVLNYDHKYLCEISTSMVSQLWNRFNLNYLQL